MTNRHTVGALIVLVVGIVAPSTARAQVVPSPPWGEPIQDALFRFVVLPSYNYQAVYDNETGLVWEQAPATTARDWANAQFYCNNKTVGNRKGWRLPTIQELASLIDPTVPFPGPTLPDNHPFNVITTVPSFYWSATSSVSFTSLAWGAFFTSGTVNTNIRANPFFVWCVRGGRGVDAQ